MARSKFFIVSSKYYFYVFVRSTVVLLLASYHPKQLALFLIYMDAIPQSYWIVFNLIVVSRMYTNRPYNRHTDAHIPTKNQSTVL